MSIEVVFIITVRGETRYMRLVRQLGASVTNDMSCPRCIEEDALHSNETDDGEHEKERLHQPSADSDPSKGLLLD